MTTNRQSRFDVYTACPLPPNYMRSGAEPRDVCYAGFEELGSHHEARWAQVLTKCIRSLQSETPPLIGRFASHQYRPFLQALHRASIQDIHSLEPNLKKYPWWNRWRAFAFAKEPWVFFRPTQDESWEELVRNFCVCLTGGWVVFFDPADSIVPRWKELRERIDSDPWTAIVHEVGRCSSILLTDDDCRLDLYATQARFDIAFRHVQDTLISLGYILTPQKWEPH